MRVHIGVLHGSSEGITRVLIAKLLHHVLYMPLSICRGLSLGSYNRVGGDRLYDWLVNFLLMNLLYLLLVIIDRDGGLALGRDLVFDKIESTGIADCDPVVAVTMGDLSAFVLNIVDVLVNIHSFGVLDVEEELLGVASDLSARPALDEFLDLLPVFTVQPQSYRKICKSVYLVTADGNQIWKLEEDLLKS